MTDLNSLLLAINSFIWGAPMLIFLATAGVFLTAYFKLMPIRKIGVSISLLFKSKKVDKKGKKISPFASLMTALSATVGTGNIAGVATAIYLGGPGAIFYMWVVAIFGMSLKYAEAVCSISYRQTNSLGNSVGGPMYYLKYGVGQKFARLGSILALLFAVCGAVAALIIGNGIQIHSIADVVHARWNVPTYISGIVVACFIGLVIIGGIKSISTVASKIVPTMIVCYVGCALFIVFYNYQFIPHAFGLIFEHAFTPIAAAGGFAGAAVANAVHYGLARGLFSNEAGMGSAAIAHAAANNSPMQQGHIAVLGVLIDTILICTLTALCILVTGVFQEGVTGAPLTALAFSQNIPGGDYIVTIALIVFGFTTLLGWSYYGERCYEYIFGTKYIFLYRIVWVLAVFWFANQKIEVVWNLAETSVLFMVIPNVIGLLIFYLLWLQHFLVIIGNAINHKKD